MKDHLYQEQTNLRSTQSHQDLRDNIHPKQEHHSHNTLTEIINTNYKTSKSYSDQIGRLPILSSRGNQYIFVLYHYDTNSIHAQPLKNRQALEITKAWKTCHKYLLQHGTATTLHILDNKCSSTMQKSFRKYNVNFQLVPPYTHRLNAAKREIRKFQESSVRWTCLL